MTREEMWKEFENQLIRETRTPVTMSFGDAEKLTKLGIKETVAKWKRRLEQTRWIPFKTRPMTEEEMTFYRDWAEYGAELFDCPLPDDGQEVLVSWCGNVCIDTFVKDDSDGCYFEGVDIDDVEAWCPLPEPYNADKEVEK